MNRSHFFFLNGLSIIFLSLSFSAVANTLVKQRPTALIDIQYQSENDEELSFRHAQIGYIGQTGDLHALVNLDLVNADKSTSQEYTPILDEAWINYQIVPIFSIKVGLQRTAFGMAYSRRDGNERFINRGGFDTFNINEALGLSSKLRFAKQGFWHLGIYQRAERSALIDSTNLDGISDAPNIATRFEYQFHKAIHFEGSFFWQLHSRDNLNNQFGVDFGVWGYFTPKLRGEFELTWVDGIRGISGESSSNALWALSYRFNRSWKGYFRYQATNDDALNLQEAFLGGAQYNLNTWSLFAIGWEEVTENPNYSGIYRPESQLFLQAQFKH